MSVYQNNCGTFAIRVGNPHPMWVTLTVDDIDMPLFRSDELHDLRHLIERAIAACEAHQP